MIIDIHGHVSAAPELYRWKANILASRGVRPHGFDPERFSDEFVQTHPETLKHLDAMDRVGTNLQLISPWPYQLMHVEKPVPLVEAWAIGNHDYIAQLTRAFPDRFRGVCGLPQAAGEPVTVGFEELERTVLDLGFVGTLIDPDPGEGDNRTPTLDDEYWYPLWEKLSELDVPALVHATASKHSRATYIEHGISEATLAALSLVRSRVFEDFPDLRLVIAFGGGALPYQIGRWRAEWAHRERGGDPDAFDARLRRLCFDTCLHSRQSLELLIRTVGTGNVVFGTERPGRASVPDRRTGCDFDDIRALMDGIEALSTDDRLRIFEGNARRLFGDMGI